MAEGWFDVVPLEALDGEDPVVDDVVDVGVLVGVAVETDDNVDDGTVVGVAVLLVEVGMVPDDNVVGVAVLIVGAAVEDGADSAVTELAEFVGADVGAAVAELALGVDVALVGEGLL